MQKSESILLAVIIFLASFLRIEMVQDTLVKYPIRADARDYYFAAYNLKQFGVYSTAAYSVDSVPTDEPRPDALRPPGYPLFIYPFIEFPPTLSMLRNIQYAQAVLSVLVIPLVFFALRPLVQSGANLLVAASIALSPHLISMNIYLLTESLYTFLIAVLIYAISLKGKLGPWKWALLVGLVIALSALVKPTSVYLAVFIGIGFFIVLRTEKPLMLSCCLLLGFFIAYLPWQVRNQTTDIAPTRSLAAGTIQKGMYPGLLYQNDPRTFGYPNRYDPDWDRRSESMKLVLSEIANRFESNPIEYSRWYFLGKPLMFLSWGIIVGQGDVFIYPVSKSPMLDNDFFGLVHYIGKLTHWPLTFLAMLCVVLLWLPFFVSRLPRRNLIFFRLLSLTLIYFIAVHVIGTPLPRYSIPIRPIIFVLGIFSIQLIYDFIRPSATPPPEEEKNTQ